LGKAGKLGGDEEGRGKIKKAFKVYLKAFLFVHPTRFELVTA